MGGAIHLIPIHLHGVHKDDFNLAAYFHGRWLIYAKLMSTWIYNFRALFYVKYK
jgi:hypothetical protein